MEGMNEPEHESELTRLLDRLKTSPDWWSLATASDMRRGRWVMDYRRDGQGRLSEPPTDTALDFVNRRQARKIWRRRLHDLIRAITPRVSRRAVADTEPLLRRKSS